MRGSVRRRMRTVAALTALTLGTMAIVDVASLGRVERELAAIESQYLPLLDIAPAVDAAFVTLRHDLQEAVAAHDEDALEGSRARKARLDALLDGASAVVDPDALASLRRELDAWYAAAFDVSSRLLREESGEALVGAIGAMQARQRAVEEHIRRTLVLDRRRLAAAFESARDAQSFALWLRMAVRAGLVVAVGLLVAAFARNVLGALRELVAGFERFGRGDFSEPVRIAGDDEFAEAARHANRMAGSLRELDAQLRGRQAELERANKELEAFSYSVSHDLRAPLRSIDGFSQAVLEDFGDQLPAEAQEHLQRVRSAAQRMAELIDDILQLSRISRTGMRRQPVDVSRLANEVLDELAKAEPQRDVERVVAGGLTAEADPALLRIAFENLLGNAWKFTSKVEHARIEVGPLERDGQRGFYVRDNGAGFDPAAAGKLFTPFHRLHSGREFPGTGIGLATVQRIVHRHGGQAWAEGTVGGGATFAFSLSSSMDGEHAQ